MRAILILIACAIIITGLDFLIAAGIIKIICLCFGLAFSWKIAVGIWVIMLFLQSYLIRPIQRNGRD